jgi:hypothetical protein
VCTRNCSINADLAALNSTPPLKRRALHYALGLFFDVKS